MPDFHKHIYNAYNQVSVLQKKPKGQVNTNIQLTNFWGIFFSVSVNSMD